MWQFQMMRAVLCAIMYIIILSVLRNRRVTNLYLSMCLYFQESMKKPRCVLWPPFWKLLHLHVIDMSAYLNISCLFFFFWCMWIICVNTNLVVKHLPVWTLWSAVCSFVVLPIQSKSSICKIQVYVMSRNCWPISQSLSFFFSLMNFIVLCTNVYVLSLDNLSIEDWNRFSYINSLIIVGQEESHWELGYLVGILSWHFTQNLAMWLKLMRK